MKYRIVGIVAALVVVVIIAPAAIILGVAWKRVHDRDAAKVKVVSKNWIPIAGATITYSKTNNGKYPRTYFYPAAFPVTAPSAPLDILVAEVMNLKDPAAQADVLRGMTEALQGRAKIAMPSGWMCASMALRQSHDPQVKKLATRLSLIFGDPTATEELRSAARNPQLIPERRLSAIEALAGVYDEKLGSILPTLLDDPSLRDVAIRDLAAYSEPSTPAALLDRYASFTQPERRDALSTLGSRGPWGAALLDAVAAGKVPKSDISALTIRQLSALNDPAVNDRLKKDYGNVRPLAKDKAALLEKYRKTFTPDMLAGANLSHGREVFGKTCGVCHTLFDAGGKLGPNLTGSQRANIDYLLQKIADPSATVPKENFTALIETTDGRTITGLVVAETDKSIGVRDATQDVTLSKSEIKSRHSLPTSMMPDGLLEAMSTADARDLLAYLQSPGGK